MAEIVLNEFPYSRAFNQEFSSQSSLFNGGGFFLDLFDLNQDKLTGGKTFFESFAFLDEIDLSQADIIRFFA